MFYGNLSVEQTVSLKVAIKWHNCIEGQHYDSDLLMCAFCLFLFVFKMYLQNYISIINNYIVCINDKFSYLMIWSLMVSNLLAFSFFFKYMHYLQGEKSFPE